MINIRVQQNGLVTTSEFPTIPTKINETDIILENIENEELEKALLDPTVDVRILNFEPLEFETTQRPVKPAEPTIEDYLIELDFRLSVIELGL